MQAERWRDCYHWHAPTPRWAIDCQWRVHGNLKPHRGIEELKANSGYRFPLPTTATA